MIEIARQAVEELRVEYRVERDTSEKVRASAKWRQVCQAMALWRDEQPPLVGQDVVGCSD